MESSWAGQASRSQWMRTIDRRKRSTLPSKTSASFAPPGICPLGSRFRTRERSLLGMQRGSVSSSLTATIPFCEQESRRAYQISGRLCQSYQANAVLRHAPLSGRQDVKEIHCDPPSALSKTLQCSRNPQPSSAVEPGRALQHNRGDKWTRAGAVRVLGPDAEADLVITELRAWVGMGREAVGPA
jgi:hypothetical protein